MELNFGALHSTALPLEETLLNKNSHLIDSALEKAVASRKMEFIAGRICAFEAAGKLKIELRELKSGEKREPLWPETLVGSISHTKNFAIALVDLKESSLSVGIDVEAIIDSKKIETMEKMVIDEDELRFLNTFGDKKKAYTITFSAKEALYKLIFPLASVFFGFKEAKIISLDMTKGRFELELISKQRELERFNGIYPGQFFEVEDKIISVLRIEKC